MSAFQELNRVPKLKFLIIHFLDSVSEHVVNLRHFEFFIMLIIEVIFQKRVRVFHRDFKHEQTDESTKPQAECFYCFRVFETPMKHEARVFEITSPTKEN